MAVVADGSGAKAQKGRAFINESSCFTPLNQLLIAGQSDARQGDATGGED
jgi:hypothetical protein